MAGGYCGICRKTTRGSYTVHAGTAAHRARLVTAERKRGNKVVGRIRATRRANAGRSLRTNVSNWYKALTFPVKRHRRRRPNDGPAKSVTVTRHYRRPPSPKGYVSTKLHQVNGAWYRVRYLDGVATSMRRATRREVADPTMVRG